MPIKHAFTSGKADGGDATLVRPSNWNASHYGLVVVRKPSDETVNNSATLQDDDDLKFAVGANEDWIFELFLAFQSSTVADIALGFTIPNGAAILWGLSRDLNFGDSGPIYSISTSGSGSVPIHGTGANVGVHLMGTVINEAAADDLQLRWAQNTAEATDTIIRANSWLKAHLL